VRTGKGEARHWEPAIGQTGQDENEQVRP